MNATDSKKKTPANVNITEKIVFIFLETFSIIEKTLRNLEMFITVNTAIVKCKKSGLNRLCVCMNEGINVKKNNKVT
jgi:hypothetical protein